MILTALTYEFGKFVFTEETIMQKNLKIGDHVSWNSETGRVTGTIVKVHTKDFDYKGYTHHATKEDPQYEIKSEKSDHIAAHKGRALTKLHK
jgi:Hypervirulence associated proteins TUDOR domain